MTTKRIIRPSDMLPDEWKEFIEAVVDFEARSGCDYTAMDLLKWLWAKMHEDDSNVYLVIHRNDELEAFSVSTVMFDISGKRSLFVVCLYVKPGKLAFDAACETLLDMAKALSCHAVFFETKRGKAMGRATAHYGARQHTQKYRIGLGGE